MGCSLPRAAAAALSVALWPASVFAVSPFGGVAAVSEAVLAEQRGLFLAPDGTEIALSIQMDTVVDGTLVLRSIMKPFESATDRLQLYTQRPGTAETRSSAEAGKAAAPASPDGSIAFTFDRSAGLTMISSADAVPEIQVSTSASGSPDISGLDRIALDGADSDLADPVAVAQTARGPIVTLATGDLLVKHVLGPSIANIVANTADNRAIETSTVLNISLSNTAPLTIGASLFSIDAAALSLAQRPSF